jgi:hypothetical protein
MSVKYSEVERYHTRQIFRIIGSKSGYQSIRRRLQKKGFDTIGEGCYKEAFFSDKFPTLVVKVYVSRSGFIYDSTPNHLSLSASRFFLTPLAHNRRFIIQKKFDKPDTKYTAYKKIQKELTKVPSDVRHNCCWYKRKPYFFDYTT